MTQIRQNGKDPQSKRFVVPDELFMSQDIVLEQLDILEKLFPNEAEPAKKIKLDVARDAERSPEAGNSSKISPRKTPSKITDFYKDKKVPEIDVDTSPVLIDLIDSPEKQTAVRPVARTPKISAGQLRQSLRTTLEKVRATDKPDASVPSAPTTSLVDQLAEYRSKHIQNRPSTSSAPQQATSSANYYRPNEVAGPSSSCTTPTTTPRQPVRNIRDYISVVNPRGQMADKLKAAAPYNLFMTTITASKATHSEPLSITFQGMYFKVFIDTHCFEQFGVSRLRRPVVPILYFSVQLQTRRLGCNHLPAAQQHVVLVQLAQCDAAPNQLLGGVHRCSGRKFLCAEYI